jgi:hypothetical protein
MIHRCQILKADLKHCQHLGGDDPTRVPDSKIINAELRNPIGVDGGVRAPVNSKLGREFENWTNERWNDVESSSYSALQGTDPSRYCLKVDIRVFFCT